MTMLLPVPTESLPSTASRRGATGAAITPGTPANRRRPVTTAALLQLVEAADRGFDLVPVGIAVHSLTDPLRQLQHQHHTVDALDLHRATTVLTKQLKALLTGDAPLMAILALVTDPDRPALPDGRSASAFCEAAWPTVRAIARERADAAVEGAAAFGETAILRLAATRAAMPALRWWGTPGWVELVERWVSDVQPNRRAVSALLHAPELAGDEILSAVLDR